MNRLKSYKNTPVVCLLLQIDEIFQLYQYNQKMREGTITAILHDWPKAALLAGLVEINVNPGIIIQSTYFLLFLFQGSRNLLNALTSRGSKGGQDTCRVRINTCTEVLYGKLIYQSIDWFALKKRVSCCKD